MGVVSLEPVAGRFWIARIGRSHEYGKPYHGACIICEDGTVKGLAGNLSPGLIRQALRATEQELGLKLKWERIRNMARYHVRILGYEITKIEGDTETVFHSAGAMDYGNVPYEAVVAMEAEGAKFMASMQKLGEAAAGKSGK